MLRHCTNGVVFTILKNAPLINIEFSKPQPRLDLSTKPLNINSKKMGVIIPVFFLNLKKMYSLPN